MRLSALLASAAVTTFAFSTSLAHADEDYDKKPAPVQYTAPLSQTTQPSYVPQSVAMSGPSEIKSFEEGDAIPPGYRPVERRRRGLIIAGATTFGVLYGFTALGASIDADSSKPVAQALWVPGIGPFIQMGATESTVGKFFLAIDGLGQSAGLFMAIYGLASPKTVLVRNDLATVRVTPMATPTATGVGVSGTF